MQKEKDTMYITENQRVGESILFLLSARNSLANTVFESDHKNSNEMVSFLMNEATDYEIMSLLVTGKLPEEKYNIAIESYLFSFLKEQILKSHNMVVEAIGEASFNSFLEEVDHVFPEMTTTRPMIDFYQEQARAISEQNPVELARKYYSPGGKGGETIQKGMETTGKYWKQKGQAAMDTAGQAVGNVQAAGKAAIEKGLPQFKAWATSPAGQAVGGAALGALILFGAVKAYKRFFSAAAKSCAGQSGEAKSACMAKAKKAAYAKKAAFLQAGMGACAKSKNPEKCKASISRKVQGMKAKAA